MGPTAWPRSSGWVSAEGVHPQILARTFFAMEWHSVSDHHALDRAAALEPGHRPEPGTMLRVLWLLKDADGLDRVRIYDLDPASYVTKSRSSWWTAPGSCCKRCPSEMTYEGDAKWRSGGWQSDNLSAREIVLAFYEAALNEKDIDKAKRLPRRHLHPAQPPRPRRPRGPVSLHPVPPRPVSVRPQRSETGDRRGRPGGAARPFRRDTRDARAADRRHIQSRGRQGGGALGRHPGDPDRAVPADQRQRALLGAAGRDGRRPVPSSRRAAPPSSGHRTGHTVRPRSARGCSALSPSASGRPSPVRWGHAPFPVGRDPLPQRGVPP